MGVKDCHLIQITVKAHRSLIAGGKPLHVSEVEIFKEDQHVLRLHAVSHNGGLGGDHDYLAIFLAKPEQPHVVIEDTI